MEAVPRELSGVGVASDGEVEEISVLHVFEMNDERSGAGHPVGVWIVVVEIRDGKTRFRRLESICGDPFEDENVGMYDPMVSMLGE